VIVKPDRIYNADGQERINALVQSNADLSDTLRQERLVLSRMVYELTTQLEGQKEENKKLQRYLEQAQEILLDKDTLLRERDEQIVELKERIARMQEQVEEGIGKGWQLEELKAMLFGKRSERFVPAEEEVKVAIQQTFGPEFDSREVEAILVQPSERAVGTDAQQGTEKTSRHNKRHRAHKGRRPIPSHIETQRIVVDTPGDKTGYKSMGIKKSIYYDYLPGKIIKVVEEHPQYISEDGETILPAAPVKPRMVERGTVGNTLLAYMHTERFVYYVPYYRQLQRFERNMALSFAASTVDHWEEV
jgi:transposase